MEFQIVWEFEETMLKLTIYHMKKCHVGESMPLLIRDFPLGHGGLLGGGLMVSCWTPFFIMIIGSVTCLQKDGVMQVSLDSL